MEQAPYAQERRLVTVLFADFVGFTTLAESLDPEELQQLVSGIFEDLAEVAVKYDGTIEKFIGDAIFVIFGAPVAHEDDPQRALRTALSMQRVFADHAARVKKERGIELGLRIGIHTGLVVAGGVRVATQYGVMGDTVNIASRLQTAAGPGEIYVTQATFRLTQREFTFREVGPIEMKGKEQQVLAYALTGERSEKRPSIELNAPLVGRWMELSRLDLAYQSSRVGRTEVVLISGEPGIGKSRLVSEFIGLAAGEESAQDADRPRVMRWTFSRVNQRSYAGFIEPILIELGIDPAAPDAARECERSLTKLRFSEPERAGPVLSQFLHLPGAETAEEGSEERKREMFVVVYDVLASLARDRPLLVVLEDLHYADTASLDLLWFVAARASRVPMLYLLAQRLGPGSPEPRPTRTNFTQLVLEPLPDEEAARIVESVVQWAPAELRDRIVARAGGNPFFIEESIRSLVESGAVARDEEGEWVVRERPAALEVPATLHAVIAARIDRLTPLAKECIQLASVIGQRFGDRVLRAAGGDRIADAVDALIAADLVLEAAPGERREGRYRFKHAVTQEVAYNTLLVRRRVELHRRVAAAFEEALGDGIKEFYPALSHHYLMGEVPDKAAKYAWKAAQRAISIHAHGEALRFAETALELWEKAGETAKSVEALHLVARIRRLRGEYDAALAAYERALGLLVAQPGDHRQEIANLYAHMAELATRWGAKHPDLDGLIAEGLGLVGNERSRERVLLLAARAFLPRTLPRSTDADWEDALETARQALAIAEELGSLREVSICLDAVGFAYRELGRYREAYAANERRVPIAKSLQDNDELIDAYTMLSMSAVVLGDLPTATDHAATAREIAITTEKPRLGLAALHIEALAHLLASDFPGALEVTRRAEQLGWPANKMAAILANAMAAAAALASPEEKTLRDKLVESETFPAMLAGADFLAAYYGQRESESAYHALRSAGLRRFDRVLFGPMIVVASVRWGIDDTSFEERVAAEVERAGYARGRAYLVQAQGLRALRAGEHARAEALLLDATQAFATLRADHERACALVDHADALERLGRAAEATKERDEARAIAERLGAIALRTRIDALAVRV
ncbi:MAG TPA: adenylate/guanylate cyclase domain-containing protein [Candidatus Limnocylindria bacterium]|nr:adenylate/guanylate cyclase domain-containing protein [Candidatus Limnocylindria bacterium]